MATRRRTNILLDMELVGEAATALGTRRTTETVHSALLEVVTRERRRRLASRDFPELTPGSVDDMRRPRSE